MRDYIEQLRVLKYIIWGYSKKNINYMSYYCSYNQDKNFSRDIDSITIGIELCNIPHISEH